MKELRISNTLSLPLDWITYATVVYGNRGTGKTSFGRVAAEEATRAGQRFAAIDLKGDWWGLKSSADGKAEGIPIVIFGGDHADVPLDPSAGAFVGETVAKLGQSCVLDFELLSKGKQIRFLAEFFEALYHHNRDPLLLLLDEAQRYAPQKPGPDEARTLGAVQDLVKLGRKHGLGPVLFTQRGAGLNKEVSELCDLLVAFRTPGSLDQERIKNWLEANATDEERKSVMGKLSGLATGTAMFASSHPELKLFGVHGVRRPETFDSSATPKVGEKRIEAKKLAAPDLAELRQKMADAIEHARASDPKALRARIAELETELADETSESKVHFEPIEVIKKVRVEVPVVDLGVLNGLRESVEREVKRLFDAALKDVMARYHELHAALEQRDIKPEKSACYVDGCAKPGGHPGKHSYDEPPYSDPPEPRRPDRTATPKAKPAPVASAGAGDEGTLPKVERLILTALAQAQYQGRELTRQRLALLVGYHANSKSFANGLGALRGRGAVQGLMITYGGLRELGSYDRLPTGPALLEWYCQHKLSGVEARIAQAVRDGRGKLGREELARKLDYHPNAKSFANGLGRLRGLGIIEGLRLAAWLS
jgi:hypothetical protein